MALWESNRFWWFFKKPYEWENSKNLVLPKCKFTRFVKHCTGMQKTRNGILKFLIKTIFLTIAQILWSSFLSVSAVKVPTHWGMSLFPDWSKDSLRGHGSIQAWWQNPESSEQGRVCTCVRERETYRRIDRQGGVSTCSWNIPLSWLRP